MVQLLQTIVGRDRRLHAGPGRAGELGRRLLPEGAEALARRLEVRASRRVRVGQQSHCQPHDDRLDARFEERDPDRQPERGIDDAAVDVHRESEQHGREQAESHEQRPRRQVLRVDERDDEQRHDVVDHDHRQQERAQAVQPARADEREHAQREGGVGRHGGSPPPLRTAARVEGEIDEHRHDHPADARDQGQRGPRPLPQLAHVELAPRLEPDDEEEERHEAAVDPVAQVQGERRAADVDRERRAPEGVVRGSVDVHPGQRGQSGPEQDDRAPGLGPQEVAQRRLDAPGPRGAALEPRRRL